MKHIIINGYGYFLGLKSSRLILKKENEIIEEYPLNRLKTIHIESNGVSLSSDLVFALGVRGIKVFFNTYNSHIALHTDYEHKSVIVKKEQYNSANNGKGVELARQIIIGKIKNQRSTLLYHTRRIDVTMYKENIERLNSLIKSLKQHSIIDRQYILGIEGKAADIYFHSLLNLNLLPETFTIRTKRYSTELTNIALNYGYAILENFIYKSIINAGLDISWRDNFYRNDEIRENIITI